MTEILQQFPQYAWAALSLGLVAIIFRLIGVLSSLAQSLARQQTIPAGPVAIPPVSPAVVPAPTLAAPKPAPAATPAAPSGPFAGAPAWFLAAIHEIGFRETGDNQGIERYISLAHAGSLGDPWCAIFANAMLESVGVPGTRSASSQSFRSNPNFVALDTPALGCIVVFWRGSKSSGLGHVGFYRGEDATRIWTLGGNESDMVEIAALPKSSSTFGFVGYYWPAGQAKPTTGPVMMPAGSPTTVTTAPATSSPAPAAASGAVQKGITATYFGGQQSAYGGPIIDNQPGVALPFRFSGARPRVRVINSKTGASVDCDIVDVGPWNINDPYWETGARPQAETGTDMTGRHTNKAGIDLTLAAATAAGIDGKGLVDWSFIGADSASSPKVT